MVSLNSQDDEPENSLEGILLSMDDLIGIINKDHSNTLLYGFLYDLAVSSLDLLNEKNEEEIDGGKRTLGKLGESYFVAFQKLDIDNLSNTVTINGGFSIYPTPKKSDAIKGIGYNMENLCVSDLRNGLSNSVVREYSVGTIDGKVGYIELRIRNTSTNITERVYSDGLPDEEDC